MHGYRMYMTLQIYYTSDLSLLKYSADCIKNIKYDKMVDIVSPLGYRSNILPCIDQKLVIIESPFYIQCMGS